MGCRAQPARRIGGSPPSSIQGECEAFVLARARETGHLLQGRFGCVAMDEAHCLNTVRYLAFNPVRARLSASPDEWAWSSVRAHLAGRDDALVAARPILALAPRFADPYDNAKGESFMKTLKAALSPN